jgi:hypothetical protein
VNLVHLLEIHRSADEPISGIRLSDWLHRNAHDGRAFLATGAFTIFLIA